MKIGIDIDGVVYDWVRDLRDYLVDEHQYVRDTLPEPSRWEIWEAWGMSEGLFHDLVDGGIRNGVVYNRGPEYAYPGAIETLQQLKADGHELHFVTARPTQVLGATQSWLRESGIPFDSLTFSVDKAVVPVDLFIEDNIDNASSLALTGTAVFLMNRNWNLDSELPRVFGWGDVIEAVAASEINLRHRLADENRAQTPAERNRLRGEALLEAHGLITGDRNNTYGPPHQDFQRTADMMTALFGEKLAEGQTFSAAEVAQVIILVKLSRLQWTPLKRDNWVDIAGYAGCGFEAAVLTSEEEG